MTDLANLKADTIPTLPDLIIRPITLRDAVAQRDLVTRSFRRFLVSDYPSDLVDQALPFFTRPATRLLHLPGYYVAVHGKRLVAAGGWSRARSGAVGHVRQLVCEPEFAGMGIGRAIMERAIGDARAAGIRLMACLSTRNATPFYRRLGFAGDHEVELRLDERVYFPVVEMRLRLC